MSIDDAELRMTQRALDTAARWLGIGVAASPAIDIADRAGLFVLLSAPETLELSYTIGPVLQIVFFIAVGVAASALLRRHRPRARGWFFVACVIPVLLFTLSTGLRLSSVVALVALTFAFVQLRLTRDALPLA